MDASNLKRPVYPMPQDIAQRLETADLWAHYRLRPAYQQNDYIGWITQAKRPETREKRISQMLQELEGGKAYMGMHYSAKMP